MKLIKILVFCACFTTCFVQAGINEKIAQEVKATGGFYGKYFAMTEGLESFCKKGKYIPEKFIEHFKKTLSPQMERAQLTLKKIPEQTKQDLMKVKEELLVDILEEDYKAFSQKSLGKASRTSYCVFYDDNYEEITENIVKGLKEKYPDWFVDESGKNKTHAGWLQFSTEGHAKSKGLDVQVDYPENWVKSEAKGFSLHIVQVFKEKSDNGDDTLAQCMIMVSDAGFFGESSQWKEAIESPEFTYEDFLPENSKLLFAQKRTYDNEPGILLEYTTETDYKGVGILQHVMSHNVFYKNYGISVQCTVGGPQYMEWDIKSKFKKLYDTFNDFGNSITINSKYKTPTHVNNNGAGVSQNKNLSKGNNNSNNLIDDLISPDTNKTVVFIELIISILFTWGLGLLIPLAIRYKLVKKPLKEFPAWITALIQGISMIIISEALGNHGKHFALILVTLVSHSILTHKKAGKNGKKN